MKLYSRKGFITLTLIFALMIPAIAQKSNIDGKIKNNEEKIDRFEKISKELNLNIDQHNQIKALINDRKSEIDIIKIEAKRARNELRKAYKDGAGDAEIKAKSDKMQSFRERFQMINKEYQAKLKEILTPEQYEKAIELRDENSRSATSEFNTDVNKKTDKQSEK